MSGKLHIILFVLLPLFSWSNVTVSLTNGGGDNPIELPLKPNFLSSIKYQEGGRLVQFNHRPYLSFGIRNFMVDYQATVQFKNWAEIGAGVGLHRNAVKFYSASDQHTIRLMSLPTYATVTIYPYHDDNRAFYIKGNYGFVNNLSGEKNQNDNSLQGNIMQAGIGYKQFSSSIDRYWFVELSQYSSMGKGTFKDPETYSAETNYNLQFYGIILSAGINLNKF
jgi:hypothetical protein